LKRLRKIIDSRFSITSKIAVLGLNSHCGDGGVIGKEDDAVLKTTLKKIFDKGTLVFGPCGRWFFWWGMRNMMR
jgi:4-hydroxythreonine-4-phosphate dehydrogenase